MHPGTTVPLLLHNALSVPVVIVPIQAAYLGRVGRSVTVAGQSVCFSGFGFLFGGGGWFGWTWWFELLFGRPPFTLLLQ